MNNDNKKKSTDAKVKSDKKKKSKKAALIILSVILVLIIALVGFGILFVNGKLNLIGYDESTTIDTNQEFVETDDDKMSFEEMDDATGSDYKSILKNWATNGGEKMSNKNVINVLLIGSDASAEEPGRSNITDKGNTDAMILVSIDKVNKTVKLVSFMRDSYTYMDGFDRYAKLNAACANGGPAYLVETIENDYKIEINGYALVDFDSFRQVIDVLGGVNVDVPQYVANYLSGSKGTFPSGDNVLLNGDQALRFSRIRKSDANGDVSRVQRQRQVISALINKCKGASLSQINDVADVILANVRTNIGKKEILSYATQAVTDDWANYALTEITMPTPDARYGYSGSAWIWVVDYPLAAQNLQKELYGTTNIVLDENRTTAITVVGGRAEKSN